MRASNCTAAAQGLMAVRCSGLPTKTLPVPLLVGTSQ